MRDHDKQHLGKAMTTAIRTLHGYGAPAQWSSVRAEAIVQCIPNALLSLELYALRAELRKLGQDGDELQAAVLAAPQTAAWEALRTGFEARYPELAEASFAPSVRPPGVISHPVAFGVFAASPRGIVEMCMRVRTLRALAEVTA